MAYATADDLVARYDANTIGDLASDTGEPVEPSDFATNPKITAALSSASGEINSAVMQSNLYTVDQLQSLAGDDLEFLKQLTCDLAMARLMMRRPGKFGDEFYGALQTSVRERLDLIRKGVAIFNIEVVKDAGQPDVDGPSAVDYARLNLITSRVKAYFPSVASRLPIGRG